jgi:hypothetical protein
VSGLDPEVARLVEDLRSADPTVRDTRAYGALASRLGEGRLDDVLVELGDRGAALLDDDEVQARSFGALLLAAVVDRDTRSGRAGADAVRRWLVAVLGWYADEPDTRGWDPDLGWLHAVAHGADAVGELAASAHLGGAELSALLDLLVLRATGASTTPWLQDEDDRVALAVMAVLRRDLLGTGEVRAAFDRLAAAWRSVEAGPVPAHVDNAVRLARTLHLQLTLGVRPEPDAEVTHPAVRHDALVALGGALADLHWFYGRPE